MNNIDYRKEQVKKQIDSVLSTLSNIELNITQSCNRTCSFCPNTSNSEGDMTIETAIIIAKHLKEINYTGRLGLSGFGEPLLNPDIIDIVDIFKQNTNCIVELVTNGDTINNYLLRNFLQSGLDIILISVYDGQEMYDKLDKIYKRYSTDSFKIILRDRFTSQENFNNRAGALWEGSISGPCYLPFYKLMINWNGDYLVCSNDWKSETKCEMNIHNTSIKDFWISEHMENFRLSLMKKRSMTPCDKCDCQGTLVGEKQYNYFKDYYEA